MLSSWDAGFRFGRDKFFCYRHYIMTGNSNETCDIRADQNIDDASVIFFATVNSKTDNIVSVDVGRVWKGEVPKETWMWTPDLEGGEEDSNDVIVGDSYLVYGEPNGSIDGFYAFPCTTQRSTLEEAISLLGTGNDPRDFVATFDEPFPIIDGSPLGITTNGYVAAAFYFIFIIGICVGVLGVIFFRLRK